jgi:hypothetical protein
MNDFVSESEVFILVEETTKMTNMLNMFAQHANLFNRAQSIAKQWNIVEVDVETVKESIQMHLSSMQTIREFVEEWSSLGILPREQYDTFMLLIENEKMVLSSLKMKYHNLIHTSDTMKIVNEVWNERDKGN